MHRLTLSLLSIFLTTPMLSAEPVAGEWPRWRGPFDTGMARGPAPTEWTADDIAWKANVPGRGFSSPVVWGEKLFLTTAVPTSGQPSDSGEHAFLVLAFDRASGKEIWRRTAVTETPHEGYHRSYGSYASNSPVTDGEVLIAFFGSRGVYAYNLAGDLLWKRDFLDLSMRNEFGEGTAPVLHENVLLLCFDHEGEDFLLALDSKTGKELWRAERDEPSNWAPPLVLTHDGRTQAVVSATNRVRSYDIETGELIWECGGLGLNGIPAPVTDGERVYVMTGYREKNMLAIRLGGEGDLTGTEYVEWTSQRGNSYTPSPVLHEGILYTLEDRGLLSAFDAKTGEPHYIQQRLPNPYSFKSSLVGADGKLYMASESGDVVVIKMGPEYEVVAVNSFPDEFFVATPAIADGEIYLRGTNTLYCIR